MTEFPNAQTFVIFSRKAQAFYAARKLRDRGIIAGMRGGRGEYEVFGFIPDRLDLARVRQMAIELGASK